MSKKNRSSGSGSRPVGGARVEVRELSTEALDRVVGGVAEVRRPEEGALDAGMIAAAEATVEQNAAFASFRDDRDASEVIQDLTQSVTTGRLENVRGDVNYYAVQLQSGLTYSFNTTGSAFNAALALYDADGRAVVVNDDGAGATQARVDFRVPEGGSGTYYLGIAVSGGGQSGAEYRINTSAVNALNQAVNLSVALDPTSFAVSAVEDVLGQRGNAFAGFGADQNSLQAATAVTTAVTTGTLEAVRGDANYHALQLREGVTYTIDTKNSALANTVLALFDAKGNAIRVDDDGGGAGKSSLSFTVPVGGEGKYYVGVSSFGGTETGGGYRLNVAAAVQGTTVDPVLALNPDSLLVQRDSDLANGVYAGFAADQNTFQLSPAITAAVTNGALDRERGDANYHALQLRAGVTYTFDTTGSGIRDTVLALFDGKGNAIQVNDNANGLQSSISITIPTGGDGKYYLGISSASGTDTGGNYRINVAANVQGSVVDAGLALNPQSVLIQRDVALTRYDYTNFGADQNTLQVAPAITAAVTNGVLDRERGDANYHTLQLRAGVTYTFDTLGSANYDPVIALFDAKGKVLVMDDQSAGNNQARFSFTVPQGGDGKYFFGISSWSQYAGEGTAYRINIAASVQGQAVDTALALNPAAGLLVQRDVDIASAAFAGFGSDQGTLQSAPPITGALTSGTLDAQRGDANYHLVQLREGVTYTIDTRNSAIPNTVLALFDASGNAIRVDDDSGGAGKSLITFTVPTGGEGKYYVGVSSSGGTETGGGYRINIAASVQGNPVDAALALNPDSVLIQRDRDIDTPPYIAFQQDHGSQESAPFITAAAVSGRLDGAGDANYHSVRLLAGHQYTFSARGIDAALVLFDAKGNAIKADVTGEGHNAQLVFKVPADGAGLYRVGVAVAGGGTTAVAYTLDTSVKDAQDRALDTQSALDLAARPAVVAAPAAAAAAPDTNDGDSVRIVGGNLPSTAAFAAFRNDQGTVQAAVPLLGDTVIGRFDAGSVGSNYHSVALREGWTYSFAVPSLGTVAAVALFDADGRTVATSTSGFISYTIPAGDAGTYYLGVASGSAGTGDYRVNFSASANGRTVPADFALDLNNFYVQAGGAVTPAGTTPQNNPFAAFVSDANTAQEATPVTGATVTGRFTGAANDTTYHTIRLVPGLTYEFNTSGSGVDTAIALFDSSGRAIVANDDATGLGDAARISFRVPEGSGGVYYVGVAAERGAAQTGTYQLNTAVVNAAGQRIAVDDVLALGTLAYDDTIALRGLHALDVPQRDLNDARQFVVARDVDIDGDGGLYRAFSLDQGERVTSTPILGAGVAGNLGVDPGDANYHSVHLLPGLTYTFHSGGSSFNTVLALFNEKGEAVQVNNDYFGIQDKSLIRFTVPNDGGGMYYVGVAAANGAAVTEGGYQIRAMAHVDAVTAAQATQFRTLTDSGSTNRLIIDQDRNVRAAAAALALDASIALSPNALRVQADGDLNAARYANFRADASDNLLQIADRISGPSSPGTVDALDRTDYRVVELLPGVTYTFTAFDTRGLQGLAAVLMDEQGRTIATDTQPGVVRITVPEDGGGTYYLGIARTGSGFSALNYELQTTAAVTRTGEALDVAQALRLGAQTYSDYAGTSSGGAGGSIQRSENDADGFRVAADADISGAVYAGFRDDQTSVQSAVPMLGATVAGRLDNQQADANYHSVRLLPGVTYTFDTRGSSFDTVLALFDENGRALAVDDNSGARGSIGAAAGASLLRFTVPADGEGTYYLGVSSAYGRTAGADYELNVTATQRSANGAVSTVDATAALDPTRFVVQSVDRDGRASTLLSAPAFQAFVEDARSIQSAPAMTGVTLSGRLETSVRDANYHAIELLPGVTYSFDTRGSGIADPVLALFDANGRPLAANDDGPALGQNSRVVFTVPMDGGGTYYLGVAADPTARAASAPAGLEYKLYASVVPEELPASAFVPQRDTRLDAPVYANFRADFGNRQAAPELITPTVTGQLDGVKEGVDYRAIELRPGLTYTFNTTGSAFNTTLALFDGAGKLLQVNDNTAGLGDKSQVTFTVPDGAAGTYYIGVSTSGANQPGGSYTLNIAAQNERGIAVSAAAALDPNNVLVRFDADIAGAAYAGFRDDQGTLQAAPPITEATYTGSLEAVRGDANYHTLSLRPGYTYTIDTAGSRFNTVLALFDGEGRAIRVNDDAGGTLGQASRITFTVPAGAGGDYTIGVSSSGGTQTGGAYTLNIAAQDAAGRTVDAHLALDPDAAIADRALKFATLFQDDMPGAPQPSSGSEFSLLAGMSGQVTAGSATFQFSAGATYGASGTVTVTSNSITIEGAVGARVELRIGTGGAVDAGPLKASGEVELRMVAEALVQGSAYFGPNGLAVAAKAYAGVAYELEARFEVKLTAHLAVSGTGTGSEFIAAVGEARAAINDKGVDVALGGSAGIGLGASGEASVTLAGVKLEVSAGVSSGLQASFDVSGHATYDDGVISFGLGGKLALLLGIEFDFNIEIDIGALIDFGEDVADFFSNDVADFFSEDVAGFFENDVKDFFVEDVAGFFEDVGDAIVDAFEDVGDAFEDFADSFVDWITKPC